MQTQPFPVALQMHMGTTTHTTRTRANLCMVHAVRCMYKEVLAHICPNDDSGHLDPESGGFV